MAAASQAIKTQITPSYCPKCQRVYRRTPSHYECLSCTTPLIDVSDPLPPSSFQELIPWGVTFTVLLAVGLGVSLT